MQHRRDALKALAATAASVPGLASQAVHKHDEKPLVEIAKAPAKPVFFKPAEFAALTVLVNLIIPRDETPGAVDANCHFTIDKLVSRNEPVQKRWRDGLKLVDKKATEGHNKAFVQLATEQQVGILTALQADPFFRLLKEAVIETYYSSKAGLVTELGWHANTYLAEFKGCTHPEHQA